VSVVQDVDDFPGFSDGGKDEQSKAAVFAYRDLAPCAHLADSVLRDTKLPHNLKLGPDGRTQAVREGDQRAESAIAAVELYKTLAFVETSLGKCNLS